MTGNTAHSFAPELIVEVTSVCDRACAGCYAPNVVTSSNPRQLLESSPELFISPSILLKRLNEVSSQLNRSFRSVAIRGGEPTRHPLLPEILVAIAAVSKRVYLETHGRWIAAASPGVDRDELFESLLRTGSVVKISYDRMHGTSSEQLRAATDELDRHGIPYVIAITESSPELLEKTRGTASWVSDAQVIFQVKAVSGAGLLKSTLGVVRRDGALVGNLTHKFDGQFFGSKSDTVPTGAFT